MSWPREKYSLQASAFFINLIPWVSIYFFSPPLQIFNLSSLIEGKLVRGVSKASLDMLFTSREKRKIWHSYFLPPFAQSHPNLSFHPVIHQSITPSWNVKSEISSEMISFLKSTGSKPIKMISFTPKMFSDLSNQHLVPNTVLGTQWPFYKHFRLFFYCGKC